MPFVDAKVVDGKPECPLCGQKYPDRIDDYGVEADVGFWFAFKCESCSNKRRKVMVKWVTDYDFKIQGGSECAEESDAESKSIEWFGGEGCVK